jgi:2-iminoacetate synthase ThiH
MTFEDPKLPAILDKIQAGSALGSDDAMAIYRSHDLHGIAQLANLVREQRHGHIAWTRLDLGAAAVSTVSRRERIAALLDYGAADAYEPPLEPGVSGYTYLKHVAVARLLLNRVDHIVVRHCPEVENVCQLALRFGADTLLGTNVSELERQVRAAGLSPKL